MLQVTKDLMIPNHPYAKFSTGNVKTLANGDAEKNKFEVTKAMREFHVKHYKPENMVRIFKIPLWTICLGDYLSSSFIFSTSKFLFNLNIFTSVYF